MNTKTTKILTLAILIFYITLLLTGCKSIQSIVDVVRSDINPGEVEEETKIEHETDNESAEHTEQQEDTETHVNNTTHDEITSTAWQQLSVIPYFGDRNIIKLTSEQAIEYAQAIQTASPTFVDGDNYDKIIPMLIDVSNDGVPLLMIIPNGEARPNAPPAGSYYLLGFSDGRVQEICRTRNIAIVMVNNENLLCAYIDGGEIDWDYGQFSLYRINNGATELISELDFEKLYDHLGDGPSTYYINGESVSEDFYEQAVGEYRYLLSDSIHFIREHHGWNSISENDLTYEYWGSPFSREQVVQALLSYANAMS